MSSMTYSFALAVFVSAPHPSSAAAYDVCVQALEEITVPVNEYNCWDLWSVGFPVYIPNPKCVVAPHCCMPGLCKASVDCGLAKVVYETVAAGDAVCFQDITVGELFERWVDKQIALTADVLTSGLLTGLYPLVLDNIDSLALTADPLPEHLQQLLAEIIEPIYTSGLIGYTYADISNMGL